MPPIENPPGPLVSVAIAPKLESERQRLAESLVSLATDDPLLRVDRDRETGQTMIAGSSEDHVENVVQQLMREFNVDLHVGRLQVVYKETIKGTVDEEGKFIRACDERAHYAHVVLRLEPALAGEGVQFETAVKDDQLPHRYIAAVELGVREASANGVLAGYPLVDFKVTLLDGSYHDVDSSELAFKIAGAMALKKAARKALPVLLEPVMAVEVVAPEEFLGEVVADLSGRHGYIQAMEAREGARIITARVPLKGMLGYSSALASMTKGRATHTMKFSAYLEVSVPPNPDGDEPVSLAMRVA